MASGETILPVAKAFLEQKQYPQAVELLSPLVHQTPDNAEAWKLLAAAHFELRQWPEAEKAAAQVVRLKPQSARALCNWGTALRKSDRLEEARQAQVRALRIAPRYTSARVELEKINRAEAKGRPGDSALAEEAPAYQGTTGALCAQCGARLPQGEAPCDACAIRERIEAEATAKEGVGAAPSPLDWPKRKRMGVVLVSAVLLVGGLMFLAGRRTAPSRSAAEPPAQVPDTVTPPRARTPHATAPSPWRAAQPTSPSGREQGQQPGQQAQRDSGQREAQKEAARRALEDRQQQERAVRQAPPQQPRFADVANQVLASVVLLQTDRGEGTGTVISPDGHILTNAHVVWGASWLTASGPSFRLIPAVVLKWNAVADVALLQVRGLASACPSVTLGDSATARIGEEIGVAGYPLGTELADNLGIQGQSPSVVKGTISAVRYERGYPVLQFDAQTTAGYSGGPVFRTDTGEVIGLAASEIISRHSGSTGIRFGVGINAAKALWGS